jgi:hypothetical protein
MIRMIKGWFNMVKKLVKIFGGVIAAVVLLVVIASVALIFIINKQMVEDRMEKALSRQVHIEKISVGLFSIVSGIEVKNVAVSNFKTEKQLAMLKGKPVSPNDVFASMKSLRLMFRIMPLIKKKLELTELVMYAPVVNAVKSKAGTFNFDDLLQTKKPTPEETAAHEKEKAGKKGGPEKPFTADDLPVSVSVGEVGVKDGIVNYYDGRLDQRFRVYKLTALAYDIRIDPKNLAHDDNVKLRLSMSVQSVGPVKTGGVKSFDISFDASGNARPFDLKTRRLDPEVWIHAGSPEGWFTGLQIFNAIAAHPVINKYIGDQFSFLKGKQEWKGSKTVRLDIWYKHGLVKLSDGNLNVSDASLLFGGSVNTSTETVDADIELELSESRNNAVRTGVRKQVESGLKRLGVKKYANPEKIVDAAMKPLLNKRGMIYMKYNVTGTTSRPDVRLVFPALGSLDSVIKQAVGSAAVEAGKEAGKKAIQKEGKKLIKKLPKIKLFK